MGKEIQISHSRLFNDLSKIIESRKTKIIQQANNNVVLMFWEIGTRINKEILNDERAEYGKRIVQAVSAQLQTQYGSAFGLRSVRRMMQFASEFKDAKIVSTLPTQLAWSHIIELLPLPMEAKIYYINEIHKNILSLRDLRYLISRKAFERQEIGDAQLSKDSIVPFNAFKDPYLLDALGLKDNFLEADLENAILVELEKFILELGGDFAFIERQKRFYCDGDDYYIDLLFYNRDWKRLVVVELKKGKFKPAYKGQMEFYLRWLNENMRKPDENQPVGLILCTEANRSVVELLELDKVGISVAEFWTKLPQKQEFEAKIHKLLAEAQERIERRKQLGSSAIKKQIEYFVEPENEE
jgi:predicted nuclease of restriction endonuclease-like (RecB) superfamily